MSRILIITGIILVIAGLLWPWLHKLPLGRLPGDIFIQKENFKIFLPITTSVVASIILTILLWFFRK